MWLGEDEVQWMNTKSVIIYAIQQLQHSSESFTHIPSWHQSSCSSRFRCMRFPGWAHGSSSTYGPGRKVELYSILTEVAMNHV